MLYIVRSEGYIYRVIILVHVVAGRCLRDVWLYGTLYQMCRLTGVLPVRRTNIPKHTKGSGIQQLTFLT